MKTFIIIVVAVAFIAWLCFVDLLIKILAETVAYLKIIRRAIKRDDCYCRLCVDESGRIVKQEIVKQRNQIA